jgi:hypothetical protein
MNPVEGPTASDGHGPVSSATTNIFSREISFELLKSAMKAVPKAPFGRRTTGLGAPPAVRRTPLATTSAGIRVLGVYCADAYIQNYGVPLTRHCSSSRQGDRKRRRDASLPAARLPQDGVEERKASCDTVASTASSSSTPLVVEGSSSAAAVAPPSTGSTPPQWRTDPWGARRVYVRFLVDKTMEATLPLDVMRVRYPGALIDYLLSTAAFV